MIVPPAPPEIISWSALLFVVPLLIILSPFWLIGKLCAQKAEKATGTKPKKWLFLAAGLFLGMAVYIALSDLARIGLNYYLTDKSWSVYSYDQFVKSISARMVVIILGFPLLAGAWYKATEKATNEAQEKSEVLTRKYLLSFEALVLGVIVVLSLGICLYHLFNWILGVSEIEWSGLSPALGYGGTALVFLIVKLLWEYTTSNK